jgi:WD40 repeat protein
VVDDGNLRLWDAREGWRSVEEGVGGALTFAPDGKAVAVGLRDEEEGYVVRLYAVADGRLLRSFRGHEGRITGLAFAPDGKTLASGSYDNTVLVWGL